MFIPANDQAQLPREFAARMMPNIRRIAYQIARRLPKHIRIDDLVGAGCQGLVAAVSRFDAARAEGFEAYAEMRIRGAMMDELRTADPLSRDQRAHARQIAAATRTLQGRLGRAPVADEIAAELGLPLETYWEWLSCASTSVPSELDDSVQVSDRHAEMADDHLCRKELAEALNGAMTQLPERLRRIIELYYIDGLNLREIGAQLGVSESRVCQLQAEAVRRLRDLCSEHAEEEAPPSSRVVRRSPRRAAPKTTLAA